MMGASVAKIRSLSSELLSRFGIATKAGLTFGGNRDLYETLGYLRILRPQDFRSRYARNGIASRVVEAYPDATWRGGFELIEDEDPEVSTPFEEEWELLCNRLQFPSVFRRADTLAGLGRYAIILMGLPGRISDPVPDRFSPDDLMYVTPFSEEDAVVERWDEDPASVRFGHPLSYSVSRTMPGTLSTSKGIARSVHFSRVLHIADNVLDDLVFGQPRLERVWNWLDDLDKITGGGSEAFWLRCHQGFHLDVDKDLPLGNTVAEEKAAVEAMKTAADELAHGIRRVIVTRGTEFSALGSDVANFNNQVDALLTLVSGATGIPKRILMGSERGELASTQDRENWQDRISTRREDWADPHVVRPFTEFLLEHGALPEPEEFNVRWSEMDALTMTEQAEVADKLSGLNAKAGEVVITGSEIRDRVLLMPPLEESQIEELPEDEAAVSEPTDDEPDDDAPGPSPRSAKRRSGKALPRKGRNVLRIIGGSRG
jgi:uncharacterized protein